MFSSKNNYKGWFRLAITTAPITGIIFSIPSIFGLKSIILSKDYEAGLQYYIPLPLIHYRTLFSLKGFSNSRIEKSTGIGNP